MFKFFKLFRVLFGPYRKLLLAILGVALVASVLESFGIAVFFPVFQALLDQGGGSATQQGFLALLTRLVKMIPLADPIVAAIALLLSVTFLKCLAMLSRDALVGYASGTVQHDLKTRLMRSYAASSFLFFLEKKQGELIYSVSNAANRAGVLAQKIAQLVAEGLKVTAIVGLLFLTMPWVTVGLGVVTWGYHGLTHLLSQRISYHTGKGRVAAGAAQTSVASEFFSGIRQILAFGTQSLWLKRFVEQSRIFRNLYTKDAFWLSVPKVLLEFSVVFFVFGFLLLFRFLQPELLVESLPLVGMLTLGLLKLLPSLTLMGQLRMEVVGLLGDAQLVEQALAQPDLAAKGGDQPAKSLRGEILFDKMSFGYSGRPQLFHELSFGLAQGRVTAVVGPSGSGKSTLAHLVLGLLQPSAGRILVDGVALTQLDLASWRRRIGFVSQDGFVFHETVAENIRFGRGGISSEQIRKAAVTANADPFIRQLPKGYETVVGERGMKLSGGQQQRIAIARAILEEPEILIFDEATSSLDSESERLIQDAIERLSRERTVLIIAHRLSTVQRADLILVLDQGRIVEAGSHADLMERQGRYAQLAAAGQGRVG